MPPTTTPSSLQSNCNALPNSNVKGDKRVRFVAFTLAPLTDEVRDAAVAAKTATDLDLQEQGFSGASALSDCSNSSVKAASLP